MSEECNGVNNLKAFSHATTFNSDIISDEISALAKYQIISSEFNIDNNIENNTSSHKSQTNKVSDGSKVLEFIQAPKNINNSKSKPYNDESNNLHDNLQEKVILTTQSKRTITNDSFDFPVIFNTNNISEASDSSFSKIKSEPSEVEIKSTEDLIFEHITKEIDCSPEFDVIPDKTVNEFKSQSNYMLSFTLKRGSKI